MKNIACKIPTKLLTAGSVGVILIYVCLFV